MALPLEILTEIFKYNGDYKTLYSRILVNKQWHNLNIPILWKNPLYSEGSTKIIINCLLEEDKNFLTRNSIELTFELLDKSPLHNYARFCTRFDFYHCRSQLLTNASELDILQDRLVNFILDHLTVIKEFSTANMESYLINNCHCRILGNSFRKLNKFVCYSPVNNEFIDKLANICKHIQSLEIYATSDNNKIGDDSLTQLIKAQNQIKQLTICYHKVLSDNFKKAILSHSQSIIHYKSDGFNNIDHILLPALNNLKTLALVLMNTSPRYGDRTKWLKNISQPNIESVKIRIHGKQFLSDLSDFINTNGKTLRYLSVHGSRNNDSEFLGKLFQSIAQWCENLIDLSIFYNDEVSQELTGVFNNCIKLESIKFFKIVFRDTLDGDKILLVLNQTLPKKLKSIVFPCEFSTLNVNSFDNLVKNWRGPKPFTIKFNDHQKLVN